ncbi:protein kinase [Candidatus Woesearchaeota archaeon]|jgi:hypothetical protein|nr:protein kinase [Candidatus Woesearchaeota archaeon]MBT4111250.1 protein kinase [Candidatus Woesearchaeota archaeon]MBT4336830.1 protein kinase [Candidatus Woesearchaeota archaeon]MBT4469498.1 protein kinase [Candidatus Woesearchaeota archaeon]MBT6744107.1 protein kinase [Candidatus Woesearchaeota archaeon]
MSLEEDENQYTEEDYGGPHYRTGGMAYYGEGDLEDRLGFLVAKHDKDGDGWELSTSWALYSKDGNNRRFGGSHDNISGIRTFPNGLQFLNTDNKIQRSYFSIEGIEFSVGYHGPQSHDNIVANFANWQEYFSYDRINPKTLQSVKNWLMDDNNPIDQIKIELVAEISEKCLLDKSEALFGINPSEFLDIFSEGLRNPFYQNLFSQVIDYYFELGETQLNPHELNEAIVKNTAQWYSEARPYEEDLRKKADSLAEGANAKDCLDAILKQGRFSSVKELGECASIQLPHHYVIKKHASGGWSQVYLIIDKGETDEDFIKVLKVPKNNIDMNKDPNVKKIIEKNSSIENTLKAIAEEEKRINSKTSNTSNDNFPNFEYRPLPQFHESYVGNNGIPLLIYEFIRGETLEDHFEEERPLEEKLDVLTRTAYSLNYIHQKGFTHNDIKKDNFMRSEVNDRVYLLDLGLSRVTESDSSIRGKRAYAAPERITGQSNPSEEADQYSFGVMAYEILTGELPIDFGETEEEKAEMVIKVRDGEVLPDYELLRERVPSQLAEIIEICLSYDPKDRYGSMQEVEDQLWALQNPD